MNTPYAPSWPTVRDSNVIPFRPKQDKCSRETFLDLLAELDKAKAAWMEARLSNV